MTLPKYLTIKQETPQTADMYISGEVVTDEYSESDTSASGFRDALQAAGPVSTINLHINSPGGSVFEGIAIENMLKQNKAKVNVYVDGLAASIASVIAMSGDTIFMPENAMMMIHNPWEMVLGNANELRKAADDLDQITKASVVTYLAKAGEKLDESKLTELMDNETWLTADEAISYGLADQIMNANQVAASISPKLMASYRHVPESLTRKPSEQNDYRQRLQQKAKQSNQLVNSTLGGF